MGSRHGIASTALLLVACGAGAGTPSHTVEAPPRASIDFEPAERPDAEPAPAPAPAVATEAASEPDEPPSPLMTLADEGLSGVRLVGLHAVDGRWHVRVLEQSSEGSDALTSRPVDERLRSVTARWELPVPSRRVLAVREAASGPAVAHLAETAGDTTVTWHPLGEGAPEPIELLSALGPVDREEGRARVWDFVPTDPPRGLVGWEGRSRRPRPRAQVEAELREIESVGRHQQSVRMPPTHRTVAEWHQLTVTGRRGAVPHVIFRVRSGPNATRPPGRLAGAVAGDARHAFVFTRERRDGLHGLSVWFLDARTGRRVARYEETPDERHDFSFRAARFDAEGRLWLVGVADGDASEAPYVYLFDARGRLSSVRRLPHRASWYGEAALVGCGGAVWLATAAVQSDRREALHAYRLPVEGDIPASEVLFEADSPYGPGDSIWHTHELTAACHDGEAAAAFRYAPRHGTSPQTPFGFVRWRVAAEHAASGE